MVRYVRKNGSQRKSRTEAPRSKASGLFCWVGVGSAFGWVDLRYQSPGYRLMQWTWAFGQGVDLIPQGLSAPPDLDVEQLMTLPAHVKIVVP